MKMMRSDRFFVPAMGVRARVAQAIRLRVLDRRTACPTLAGGRLGILGGTSDRSAEPGVCESAPLSRRAPRNHAAVLEACPWMIYSRQPVLRGGYACLFQREA